MNGFPRLVCALLLTTAATHIATAQPTNPDNAPLPKGALARLGSLRLRAGGFSSLAFLPDDKSVIICGYPTGICRWDLATGQRQQTYWDGMTGGIAVSRDGRLALGGSNVVKLWEVASGKELHTFGNAVSGFAIAPDGKLLALGWAAGLGITLVDAKTGKPAGRLSADAYDASHFAFSPDGKWLGSYDLHAGRMHLWNMTTREHAGSFSEFVCRSFAFTADAKAIVTASADGKLRVRAVPSGTVERLLGEQKAEVTHVASVDGRLIAAGLADGIHVWDTATWTRRRHWRCDAWVRPLAFSHTGKMLAVVPPGEIAPRFWDVTTGDELRPTRGHHGTVQALAFSADGRTLHSLSEDGTARVWDWQRATELKCVTMGGYANHLALTSDGRTGARASSSDERIQLWDVANGKRGAVLRAPKSMRPFVFSLTGRLLAWQSWEGKMCVWDALEGRQKHAWASPDSAGIRFSADGNSVAYGERVQDCVHSILHVRDLQTGRELHRIDIAGNIAETAASPHGKLWATTTFDYGRGGELRLWDAATWKPLGTLGYQDGYPLPQFSPDSRLLALPNAQRKAVRIIEVVSGREARRFDLQSCACQAAFSPDNRVLTVSADNSTIVLWDVTGRLKQGRLPASELSAAELDRLWQALAQADAARALDAVWALAAAPELSVPYLAKHLPPASVPPAVPRLIRDLDNEAFEIRDHASQALRQLGETAEPALGAALKKAPSVEVKRRLELLLDHARLPLAAGDALRGVRAVQALEMAATVGAEEQLRRLAGGVAESRLTLESQAALARLCQRARPAGSR